VETKLTLETKQNFGNKTTLYQKNFKSIVSPRNQVVLILSKGIVVWLIIIGLRYRDR